ncbi:MAG: amidohydrolase family protein [Woeseiaceae bacterium]|nr:amidohydrolase family protein [Woeseiaceae bacterium]
MKLRFLVTAMLAIPAVIAGCSQPANTEPDVITDAPFNAHDGYLLLRCGALIDGVSDELLPASDILLRDGAIEAVGQDLDAPSGAAALDLSGHTCLPGFIDMHTHVVEQQQDTHDLSIYFVRDEAETLEYGRPLAKKTLLAGFTTVRNVGVYYGWTSRTMRDEIARGETIGPRMHVAGFYLTVPGGGGDLVLPDINEADIPAHLRLGVSENAEEFRRNAQAAVDGGADVLKVIASGAVLAYGGVPGSPEMTPEEIRAVVEVAKAAGIPVTAHAHGAQSIKDAILAGVDTIEHASLIDDEGIRLAKEHDVALSMDVFNGDWIESEGRRMNWPEEFLRKNEETTLIQRQNFRKAHEAGVTIVFGSDAGVYPHGMNARQFSYMVEWGMSPMEAIQAATSVAARYLGGNEKLGAVLPGHSADIIAVKGNPLDDISLLESVDTVIARGLVFRAPQ